MNPEAETEIILWNWLRTNGKFIKEIYFNRINLINAPTFQTEGINKKPDFIISIDRGFGIEYIAVEIKNASNSKDVHDSGKILMYYENYVTGQTKYFIDGNEIAINHFVVATDNSPKGKLFNEDNLLITNTDRKEGSDKWREVNSRLGLIPQHEYQRTSDYLRRLYSEWRNLKKRIKISENMSSIGLLMSNPSIQENDKSPYLQIMIWVNWLRDKKAKWVQRFLEI